MKKVLLIALCLLICASNSDSQTKWYNQYFNPDYSFRAIQFTDSLHGWLGGQDNKYHGSLFHTKNGGFTWDTVFISRIGCITDLHFFNDSVGYVCGYIPASQDYTCNGYILKTTDAGKSWIDITRKLDTTISKNGTRAFASMSWLDEKHGVICGSINPTEILNVHGLILQTKDGGETWSKNLIPTVSEKNTLHFNNIKYLSPSSIILTGLSYQYVISSDSGKSWKNYFMDSTVISIRDLSFINKDTGWCLLSDSWLLRTTNGGTIWERIYNPRNYFNRVYFINNNNGWMSPSIMSPESNHIMKTNDGGYFWTSEDRNDSSLSIYRLYIDERKVGWAVGNGVLSTRVSKVVPKPRIRNYSQRYSFCDGDYTELHFEWPKTNDIKRWWSTGDTSDMIKVTKSGKYTLYIENQYGRDSTSVEIDVKPNPKPVLNFTGTYKLCEFDVLYIYPTEGFSKYKWQDGSDDSFFAVRDSGKYYLQVTDSNGCYGYSDTLIVTSGTRPNLDYKLTTNHIDFGDIEANKKGSSSFYLSNLDKDFLISKIWVEPQPNNFLFKTSPLLPAVLQKGDSLKVEVEFNPEKNFYYTANLNIVINQSCDAFLAVALEGFGVGFTGVDNLRDDQIYLSPNPACDFIEISGINPMLKHGVDGTLVDVSDVKIYNVFGQRVNLTPALPASREGVRIDVSGLMPGMYFVRIGDRLGKFVKL